MKLTDGQESALNAALHAVPLFPSEGAYPRIREIAVAAFAAGVAHNEIDARRWRKIAATMTHEQCGPNVGWTLSILLPGDDPESAVDALPEPEDKPC